MNKSRLKRVGKGLTALGLAATIWIPTLHFFFAREVGNFTRPGGLSPKAKQLAARHLQLWTDPVLRQKELDRMRASNAEWDFMGRTFLVWSLAEMSLRNPSEKAEYLQTIDRIIAETLQLEEKNGMFFFLMPYARVCPYVMQPPRSLFLESEIALMMGVRRMVEEKIEYRPLMRERIDLMESRMRRGPVLCAESYPDECWLFDQSVALAAMKLADCLDGSDHSAFQRQWLDVAKQKLVDRKTGLLISSFTVDGQALDGPEGSSIWLVSHCLRLVDENFARDQYRRARKELGRKLAGFAWSREWPPSWVGEMDVDSGPVIPVLEISAGASGMAFIAASSFQDADYLAALAATLDFSAFPSVQGGRLKYCASNQVGDAALLYASVLGPLWEKAEHGKTVKNGN
jgi:hypothetical protein